MVKTIECPYCHKMSAVKVWFSDGYVWTSRVVIDPYNDSVFNQHEMYVCISCGRVTLAEREECSQ